jgi:proteasome accessory factor B
MSVSRIYRILKLITILQSGRSYSVDELAEELEVSRRTVFRDLNMLELAHIPYYFDRDRQTYRINQHFFLSPVNLSLTEALTLLLAAKRQNQSVLRPMAAASQRAALKLESVLPQAVREYLGELLEHVNVVHKPVARQEGLEGTFDQVLSAIGERRVCRLVYLSFYDKKQVIVVVEPLRLLFVGRAWYLVAWSRQHKQRRTFKLGRMKKLTLLKEQFAPRPDESANDFGDAWAMIPEGKLYDVHLHFSPTVAGNVAEVAWHHSQQVQWREDGSLDFRARVDGLGEILWWVLGYGDMVKVPAA